MCDLGHINICLYTACEQKKLASARRLVLFITVLYCVVWAYVHRTRLFHSAESCTERDVGCTVLSRTVRHQRGRLIRLWLPVPLKGLTFVISAVD